MQPSGAPQPSQTPVPEPGAAPSAGPAKPGARPPVPMPDMCLACGQMLRQADVVCPSCGAAVRGARRPRGLDKLKVAGFLLVAVAAVAVFFGVALLMETEDSIQAGPPLPAGDFAFTGVVRDANGTPLEGVLIVAPSGNGTTGPDGNFSLSGMRGGYQAIEFRHGEGTKLVLRMVFLRDETAAVIMPAGQAQVVQDHASYTGFLRVAAGFASVMVAIGGLIFLAAISCYRKRRFPLALTGAIVAIIAGIVYLPMILLGIVATVLVSRSRKDFR